MAISSLSSLSSGSEAYPLWLCLTSRDGLSLAQESVNFPSTCGQQGIKRPGWHDGLNLFCPSGRKGLGRIFRTTRAIMVACLSNFLINIGQCWHGRYSSSLRWSLGYGMSLNTFPQKTAGHSNHPLPGGAREGHVTIRLLLAKPLECISWAHCWPYTIASGTSKRYLMKLQDTVVCVSQGVCAYGSKYIEREMQIRLQACIECNNSIE